MIPARAIVEMQEAPRNRQRDGRGKMPTVCLCDQILISADICQAVETEEPSSTSATGTRNSSQRTFVEPESEGRQERALRQIPEVIVISDSDDDDDSSAENLGEVVESTSQ